MKLKYITLFKDVLYEMFLEFPGSEHVALPSRFFLEVLNIQTRLCTVRRLRTVTCRKFSGTLLCLCRTELMSTYTKNTNTRCSIVRETSIPIKLPSQKKFSLVMTARSSKKLNFVRQGMGESNCDVLFVCHCIVISCLGLRQCTYTTQVRKGNS